MSIVFKNLPTWPINDNVNIYQHDQSMINIIYSYKYLESDLITHCHVIFIHSLGQPLIVRSHSKVHRSRGNPKEIPTWASHVSNYSYFPWFNRQQTWRVFNHLESVTKLHVFIHLESVAKLQVFYYLVSDAKIFDII